MLKIRDGTHVAFDSVTLTPEARRQIDHLVGELKAANNALPIVAGHINSPRSVDYNHELGQRRAASVSKCLITRKRLGLVRVSVVSYGGKCPTE